MKTLCFTGHRPKALFGYDQTLYTGLMLQLTDCVKQLYENAGYRKFISGGAQGFDQLAFWAVDNLKKIHPDIINVVYVPFAGQEQKWLQEGLFSQTQYRQMLSVADEVRIISDNNDISALFKRNDAMIEDSDGILCLYEDDSWKDPNTKDGTAEAMRFANNHMMDIWQIVFDKTRPAPYDVKTIQLSVFK